MELYSFGWSTRGARPCIRPVVQLLWYDPCHSRHGCSRWWNRYRLQHESGFPRTTTLGSISNLVNSFATVSVGSAFPDAARVDGLVAVDVDDRRIEEIQRVIEAHFWSNASDRLAVNGNRRSRYSSLAGASRPYGAVGSSAASGLPTASSGQCIAKSNFVGVFLGRPPTGNPRQTRSR